MQSQFFKHNKKTANNLETKFKSIKQNQKSSGWYFILSGIVTIILGLSLIMLQATIMCIITEKLLNLNSDSFVFKMWQKYPMEVPVLATFFNWTNHKDFYNKSIKPKFEEIGPYAYLQNIEKVDIVRNNNNNTITFKQIRLYHYDYNFPNNGNLSDRLITINYLTMYLGHYIKDYHDAVKDAFSEFTSLFDPYYYSDTIIDNEIMKGKSNLLLQLLGYFDFISPDVPRLDGYGWIKLRNGDPNFDGVYNIGNGVNRQFDVLNWNYRSTTPHNTSCGKIKGSMGDVYSFPLKKDFIAIFSPEACRHLTFYFEEEVMVDGIMGYKYTFTKLSLDNGTLNSENECFCDGPCIPSGIIGVSPCRYNLNGYISSPHYYNADPIYLNPFEGLNPDKQKHESYIVVEPNSLLCLEVHVALQFNMLIYPVEGISFFDDYPKLHFPLVWIKSHVQLPDELKKYLQNYLKIPYGITIAATLIITLGICVTCYGLYKFFTFKRSLNMDQGLTENVPLNQ